MYDICAIGELIIDFTPAGVTEQGFPLFACNPGGAPGNVMVCLSRLGKATAFIGKVGKDQFGAFFTRYNILFPFDRVGFRRSITETL